MHGQDYLPCLAYRSANAAFRAPHANSIADQNHVSVVAPVVGLSVYVTFSLQKEIGSNVVRDWNEQMIKNDTVCSTADFKSGKPWLANKLT